MPLPVENQLLAYLGSEATFLSQLESVPMPSAAIVFESHQVPRHVYFLTSGIASIVAYMSQGEAIEVGLVGSEGIPGATLLIGPQTSPTRCFMQVAGTALRMPFKAFQEEMNRNPAVLKAVMRYVQYESFAYSQISACNRLHEVEERLARWLLMVQDRIQDPTLRLTQEFLAQMLGTRRSSVTLVAGTLQRSGLIEYSRGVIRIIDRAGLESTACECYGVVRGLMQKIYLKSSLVGPAS